MNEATVVSLGATRWTAAREARTPGTGVMRLLAGHVPLSLLMDLTMPAGPHSQELLTVEGLPDGPWWDAQVPDAEAG